MTTSSWKAKESISNCVRSQTQKLLDPTILCGSSLVEVQRRCLSTSRSLFGRRGAKKVAQVLVDTSAVYESGGRSRKRLRDDPLDKLPCPVASPAFEASPAIVGVQSYPST